MSISAGIEIMGNGASLLLGSRLSAGETSNGDLSCLQLEKIARVIQEENRSFTKECIFIGFWAN